MSKAIIDLDKYHALTDSAREAIEGLKDAAHQARTSRDRETLKRIKAALETALDAAMDNANGTN